MIKLDPGAKLLYPHLKFTHAERCYKQLMSIWKDGVCLKFKILLMLAQVHQEEIASMLRF